MSFWNKFLVAMLVLGVAENSGAVILVQAERADETSYLARLKAQPSWRSPTTWWLGHRPSAVGREGLLTRFAAAQTALLEASPMEARRRILEVVDLRDRDDWMPLDREILVWAYLRLAQLAPEDDEIARDRFLLESLAVGHETRVDATLFPPPLLARRAELAARAATNDWPKAGAAWSAVVVDGVVCTRAEFERSMCPRLIASQEKRRVSFVSDRWQTQTELADAREIASLDPGREPWLSGSCTRSAFRALPGPEAKPFWGEDCGGTELAQVKTIELKDLKPRTVTAVAERDLPSASPAFFQRRSFWIGVGLAAVVAVIAAGAPGKEKKETTTTYGP